MPGAWQTMTARVPAGCGELAHQHRRGCGRLMKSIGRAVAVALGIGVVAAGCSDADGRVRAGQDPGLVQVPAEADVIDVVAGRGAGWLFTVGGGETEGEVTIWRVDPTGEAREVSTVERRSGNAAALGDGLAVARTTCSSGGYQCIEDGSVVDIFDGSGEHLATLEGASPDQEGAEATARVVAGEPGDEVWVDLGDRFVWVDSRGTEIATAPPRPGVACAVDGELVVIDPPNSAGTSGDGTDPIRTDLPDAAPVTFTASVWADGRWTDAGSTTVRSASAEVACIEGTASVVDFVDLDIPLARWTLDGGWGAAPSRGEDFAPGLGGVLRSTSGHVFSVDDRGSFVVRTPDDLAFVPVETGLRVEVDGSGPPPGIAIDQSDEITLACHWSIVGDDGVAGAAECRIDERP